jgi:hypothetical protein
MAIVLRLEHRVKLTLRRTRRETRDKGLADRCQIVLLTAKVGMTCVPASPFCML